MLRGRSWLLLAAVPMLAACALIYRSDLDDARRPGADGADGGPDATSAADAGTVDAGTDAGPGGCAAYPDVKFCDDFDTKLNVSDGWDELSTDQGATVLFDSVAYSAPLSFRATLENSPDCRYGRLEKRWTGVGTKRVRASFRIRPEGPWKGGVGYAFFGTTGCSIVMGLDEDAPTVSANINAQYVADSVLKNDVRDLDGAPYPDEWTDVIYELTPSDGHAKLNVKFVHPDGEVTDKTHDLPQCKLAGEVELDLGYHCSSGTHAIRYDDVRLDWE